MERNGIEGVTGILEYPELRETSKVYLTDIDREAIANFESDIEQIVKSENCPQKLEKKRCKNCSYFDFCWSGEE
jgi:CRISPR-associated exonuclease Cas4